jgi:hypothetical protein
MNNVTAASSWANAHTMFTWRETAKVAIMTNWMVVKAVSIHSKFCFYL